MAGIIAEQQMGVNVLLSPYVRLAQVIGGWYDEGGGTDTIIPEAVNQVSFEVIGNDITVTLAAEAGQLELNVMEPVIAYNLFTSIAMLGRACRTLADRCIRGIAANRERARQMVEDSIGLVTALNPILGYEKSTEIAQEALKTGRSVYSVVIEKGYLNQEQLEEIQSPDKMTHPRYTHYPHATT